MTTEPHDDNVIVSPTDRDVLCGNGRRIMNHLGNKDFRERVKNYYATGTHRTGLIGESIVDEILQRQGRFLKLKKQQGRHGSNHHGNNQYSHWAVLSRKEAIKKAAQAIRDAKPSKPTGIVNHDDQTSDQLHKPTVHVPTVSPVGLHRTPGESDDFGSYTGRPFPEPKRHGGPIDRIITFSVVHGNELQASPRGVSQTSVPNHYDASESVLGPSSAHIVQNPKEHDVLCANGRGFTNHPGNADFRALVKANACQHDDKRKNISGHIVDWIMGSGGRFLKPLDSDGDQQSQYWQVLSRREAIEQTHLAIRAALKVPVTQTPAYLQSEGTVQTQGHHTEVLNCTPWTTISVSPSNIDPKDDVECLSLSPGSITLISLKSSKFDLDHNACWENWNQPRGHYTDAFDHSSAARTVVSVSPSSNIDPMDEVVCPPLSSGSATHSSLKSSTVDSDHIACCENMNQPRDHHSEDFDPTAGIMDTDPLDDIDFLSVSLSLGSTATTSISWKSSKINSDDIACWENWNQPRGQRIEDFDHSTPGTIILATHSDNDPLDNIDGLSMSLASTTTRISFISSKIDSDHIAHRENGNSFETTSGTMPFATPSDIDPMDDLDCMSLSLGSTTTRRRSTTRMPLKSSTADPDPTASWENRNQPQCHHTDDFDPYPLTMILATPSEIDPLDDIGSATTSISDSIDGCLHDQLESFPDPRAHSVTTRRTMLQDGSLPPRKKLRTFL